jgi:hypothetical protein
MDRCESFDFMKEKAPSELFDVKETMIALP